jgi:hypothetical protein
MMSIQAEPVPAPDVDPGLRFPAFILRVLNWAKEDPRRGPRAGAFWVGDESGRFYSHAGILARWLRLKQNSVCANFRGFGFGKEKAARIPKWLMGPRGWKVRFHPRLNPDSNEEDAAQIKWREEPAEETHQEGARLVPIEEASLEDLDKIESTIAKQGRALAEMIEAWSPLFEKDDSTQAKRPPGYPDSQGLTESVIFHYAWSTLCSEVERCVRSKTETVVATGGDLTSRRDRETPEENPGGHGMDIVTTIREEQNSGVVCRYGILENGHGNIVRNDSACNDVQGTLPRDDSYYQGSEGQGRSSNSETMSRAKGPASFQDVQHRVNPEIMEETLNTIVDGDPRAASTFNLGNESDLESVRVDGKSTVGGDSNDRFRDSPDIWELHRSSADTV